MQEILFEEKQRFRQWWLWLIMLIIAAETVWQAIQVLENPIRENTVTAAGIITITLLPLGIIVFIRSCQLQTKITAEGIYCRFSPIHRKYRFYSWNDMDRLYIRQYAPLREYGGWGIRGWGRKRALNISGSKGLQLEFKNGDRLLIGTLEAPRLESLLAALPQAPFAASPSPRRA